MKSFITIAITCVLLSSCVNRIPPLQHSATELKMRSEGDLKSTVLKYFSDHKNESCELLDRTFEFTPPPREVIDIRGQHNTHTQHFAEADLYASYIQRNAARFFFKGDAVSGENAIELMLEWSSENAHDKVISPRGWGISAQRYPTYQVLGSTMMVLLFLEKHPSLTPKNKIVIWNWVEGLIDKSYILKELPVGSAGYMDLEQRVNNHNSTRAILLALYAIHKNDEKLFLESNERISRSFDHFDKNGVPYDANRGNWALNYISLAIKALTLHSMLVDIVAIDPNMDEKVERMNRAADFLYEETANPTKIHEYASKNIGRPASRYEGRQQIWWYQSGYAAGLVHHAWTEYPFMKSAPSEIIAPGLEKIDVIGGAVRCWSN
jgi:hypothetical protein